MLQRLKNLWKLSKEENIVSLPSNITREKFNKIVELYSDGDGKAEFLGEGTTEEFEDMLKEDKGLKGWYDRIKKNL